MQNLRLPVSQLKRVSASDFKTSAKIPVSVLLDNVRSGHNIGSVFRTADAFNVKKIYLSGISALPPNKEVLKTALGATETVAWEYIEDPLRCVNIMRAAGEKIYAIEQTSSSVSLETFDFIGNGQILIILGNEVEGVSQQLIDACDGSIEIPQFGTKHSLNVSVTAGIVLWDFVKQQLKHAQAKSV